MLPPKKAIAFLRWFCREDYIEEAWRIVDPVLKAPPPVHEYEPGTWGPKDANGRFAPTEGWHNPKADL